MQFPSRCCIEHPCHVSMGRAYNLRGIFLRLIAAFEDGLHGVGLIRAGDEEQDMFGGIQKRWGEGQARWGRFWHVDRHDQSLLFMQGWLMGEERGGMTLWPHAKL